MKNILSSTYEKFVQNISYMNHNHVWYEHFDLKYSLALFCFAELQKQNDFSMFEISNWVLSLPSNDHHFLQTKTSW